MSTSTPPFAESVPEGSSAVIGTPSISDDRPLFIEPVIGWRVWRLGRIDGAIRLVSPAKAAEWPPRAAMEAACSLRRGSHGLDECSCGLYAASTPEYLAGSGVFMTDACIVGTIAMWGTVVEHERGARSMFAYPQRLRLVCGTCLLVGAGAVDPTSVVATGPELVAVCAEHRPSGCLAWPADAVQAELLSTYGVDLMPMEQLAGRLVGVSPILRTLRLPARQLVAPTVPRTSDRPLRKAAAVAESRDTASSSWARRCLVVIAIRIVLAVAFGDASDASAVERVPSPVPVVSVASVVDGHAPSR
jgi:hypothetical protein